MRRAVANTKFSLQLLSIVMLLQACAKSQELPTEPVTLDGAVLHYTGSRCFAVYPGMTPDLPPDTLRFQCGRVYVRFAEGTRWADVQDLLESLGGQLTDWFPASGEQVLRVMIAVPVGTERRVILKARRDERVVLTTLTFVIVGGIY
jgi:hypothetical protein